MGFEQLWREQLDAHLPTELADRAGVADRVVAYLTLLDKWNRSFNLTGVRDRADWVPRHILDSLTLLPWIDRGPVLDVGTGAGLPGVPLAIACPERTFVLLDSNGKKTRFLEQVRVELGLDNVEVRRERVESLPECRYGILTSRAFSALPHLIAQTRPLLLPGGRWLAMKSQDIEQEIADLPADICHESHAVSVPLLAAQHQIVRLWSRGDTV